MATKSLGALVAACALLALTSGCQPARNPDLSLREMRGYEITFSSTIDGRRPQRIRLLKIRDRYSTWLYCFRNGRSFALEPAMRDALGDDRRVTDLKIRMWANWWQILAKVGTLWFYEPRSIEVTGEIWAESLGAWN